MPHSEVNGPYEILDPVIENPPRSKWRKYGPFLFWGTIIVIPAMQLGTSYFDYKTATIQLEIEKIKDHVANVKELTALDVAEGIAEVADQ